MFSTHCSLDKINCDSWVGAYQVQCLRCSTDAGSAYRAWGQLSAWAPAGQRHWVEYVVMIFSRVQAVRWLTCVSACDLDWKVQTQLQFLCSYSGVTHPHQAVHCPTPPSSNSSAYLSQGARDRSGALPVLGSWMCQVALGLSCSPNPGRWESSGCYHTLLL